MFSLKVDDELELGLPQEQHAEEAFALVLDNYDHLYEWMPWVHENMTVEEVRQFYKRSLESFINNGAEIASIIVYQGKFVGAAGFHEINRRDKSAEIGYWLSKKCTGKGIMTRSVTRLVDYAFSELELHRIVIKCVPENVKSRAIPERLGFTQEGIEREAGWLHTRFVDHIVYSILANEWRKDI